MEEEIKEYDEDDRFESRNKGRGLKSIETTDNYNARYTGSSGRFESVPRSNAHIQRSVEGYIIIITNIHEEAQEDDIREPFSEFGDITNLHLNADRRTDSFASSYSLLLIAGFMKGYALIEYKTLEHASAAISGMNGKKLMEKKINVDWYNITNSIQYDIMNRALSVPLKASDRKHRSRSRSPD